jgi:hypothetical protein
MDTAGETHYDALLAGGYPGIRGGPDDLVRKNKGISGSGEILFS